MSPVGKSAHKKLPNGTAGGRGPPCSREHLVDGPHMPRARQWRGAQRAAAVVVVLLVVGQLRVAARIVGLLLSAGVRLRRLLPTAASRRRLGSPLHAARAVLTSITAGGERGHPRVVTLEAYRETVNPPIENRFGVPWTVSETVSRRPGDRMSHFGHERLTAMSIHRGCRILVMRISRSCLSVEDVVFWS